MLVYHGLDTGYHSVERHGNVIMTLFFFVYIHMLLASDVVDARLVAMALKAIMKVLYTLLHRSLVHFLIQVTLLFVLRVIFQCYHLHGAYVCSHKVCLPTRVRQRADKSPKDHALVLIWTTNVKS